MRPTASLHLPLAPLVPRARTPYYKPRPHPAMPQGRAVPLRAPTDRRQTAKQWYDPRTDAWAPRSPPSWPALKYRIQSSLRACLSRVQASEGLRRAVRADGGCVWASLGMNGRFEQRLRVVGLHPVTPPAASPSGASARAWPPPHAFACMRVQPRVRAAGASVLAPACRVRGALTQSVLCALGCVCTRRSRPHHAPLPRNARRRQHYCRAAAARCVTAAGKPRASK
jgi:hypothetical protein